MWGNEGKVLAIVDIINSIDYICLLSQKHQYFNSHLIVLSLTTIYLN